MTTSAVVALLCVGLAWYWSRRSARSTVPAAPGAVALLGHALAYKADPAGFLCAARARVGAVFRVNLAGKRMVVVGASRAAARRVALAPERALSSRDAVMAVGFEQTLGAYNVRYGTDFHRRALKDAFGAVAGGYDAEVAPHLVARVARADGRGAVPVHPCASRAHARSSSSGEAFFMNKVVPRRG